MGFFRSKKFISGLLSLVLVGVGVANPEVVANYGASAFCAVVKCDA